MWQQMQTQNTKVNILKWIEAKKNLQHDTELIL